MTANIINEYGTIYIKEDVLRLIASEACMKSYGVTGLAYKNVTDGFLVLLKKHNMSKGVKVLTEDNKIRIELTVVLEYGVRIQMVCENIMELVAYDVLNKTGIKVDEIDILVQDMKLPNEVL